MSGAAHAPRRSRRAWLVDERGEELLAVERDQRPVVHLKLDSAAACAHKRLFSLDLAVGLNDIDRKEALDHVSLRAASRSRGDPNR